MAHLTRYHLVALLLCGVGVVGIGLSFIPMAAVGALGLGMLMALPPRR